MPSVQELEIRLFLEALSDHFGYDFRGYSQASVRRRLERACADFGCETFSQLQHEVLHRPGAFGRLLQFLTVQVSTMFRDPFYYLRIREKVVPYLRTYPSLKVWIAGCSTGEELFSMAILFREEGIEDRTIFYATDINREALKRAESGVFELDRLQDFSENYAKAGGKRSLADYYTLGSQTAIFDRSLLSSTLFTDHSLVSDSVFTEAHFVSCRNVLIYFDRPLQNRAVGLFRDSLVRRGFLGLGSKESLRFLDHASDFVEVDRDERIYQKSGEAWT